MSATPTVVGAAALLERAVGYARGCLASVRDDHLGRPTSCPAWDLAALLRHMDDSLAAFTEAAEVGYVDLVTGVSTGSTSGQGSTSGHGSPSGTPALVARLRTRAGALLGAWAAEPRPAQVDVAGRAMPADLLAAAGALEIAVHGWDVAVACGAPRPLPPVLAAELLDLVPLLVTDADRPARFGRPLVVPTGAGASTRLLAALGRRTPR